MQTACDKTFAQVAGEVPGLSILKTVVSQVGCRQPGFPTGLLLKQYAIKN